MNLDEALAVFIYLQNRDRNSKERLAFIEAYEVIYREARKVIGVMSEKTGDYA